MRAASARSALRNSTRGSKLHSSFALALSRTISWQSSTLSGLGEPGELADGASSAFTSWETIAEGVRPAAVQSALTPPSTAELHLGGSGCARSKRSTAAELNGTMQYLLY